MFVLSDFKLLALRLIFLLFSMLLTCCATTHEEYIYKFEATLESFMGKKVRDVINKYGKPTRYVNMSDILDQQSGTYMIYDYAYRDMDCQIIFKFSKKGLEIIDWDYSGSCPSYYGSLYW